MMSPCGRETLYLQRPESPEALKEKSLYDVNTGELRWRLIPFPMPMRAALRPGAATLPSTWKRRCMGT